MEFGGGMNDHGNVPKAFEALGGDIPDILGVAVSVWDLRYHEVHLTLALGACMYSVTVR